MARSSTTPAVARGARGALGGALLHKGRLLDLLLHIVQLLEGKAACRGSHDQALLCGGSCHTPSQHRDGRTGISEHHVICRGQEHHVVAFQTGLVTQRVNHHQSYHKHLTELHHLRI
jgi:hypothetical protein